MLLASWTGDIPNGTVWSSAEIQRLTGSVRVPAGATLTIEPGTIIKANSFPAIRLTVEGTLIAQGTVDLPILFTAFRDDTGFDNTIATADDQDTNGDGPTSGAKGDWGGINFAATTTGSTLNHVEVRHAVSGQEAFGSPAILINGGDVTIANSTIRNALGNGIRVAAGSPFLTNLKFIDNGNVAIAASLAANPIISGGTYSNNVVNGLVLDAGTLAANTTWNNPDVVYMLSGDVAIPMGTTLTVGAGQIIKSFSLNNFIVTSNILVDGRLLTQGTPQQPVIFTSRRDDSAGGDTNNDGLSGGTAGDWGAIRFSVTSAGSVLNHTEVRSGG